MNLLRKVSGWLCLLVLLLSIPAVAGSLEGRIIVIDPGHGDSDHGGVGPTGLKEKDINLTVALFLRDMLEEDGAIVYMTRDTDVFLSLQERVDFAHEHTPDLFVSVHHNIMPNNPDESFIEVYHSVRDRGQGQVFGKILFDELVERTGVPGKTMGPGNFYLLNRIVEFPAVIGEAYYLSNPESEQALRNPEVLKQEAEAYRAAINKYFDLGIPTITVTNLNNGDVVTSLDLEAILAPDGGRVDPESIEVTLNGEEVHYVYNEETGRLVVKNLDPRPSGLYSYRIKMANTLGGVASSVERTITLSNPAVSAEWFVEPRLIPADPQGTVQVTLKLFDEWGFPILEGRTIDVSIMGGQPKNQTVTTKKGEGWFTFSPSEKSNGAVLVAEIDNLRSTLQIPFTLKEFALLSGRITSDSAIVEHATVNGQPVNNRGFFFLVVPEGKTQITVKASGFYPQSFDIQANRGNWLTYDVSLSKVADGLFVDKVIILDSEEAYDFERLSAYLEFAGAKVYRFSGEEGERIKMIRSLKPHIVISISEGDPFCGHFPRSTSGSQLAETLAEHLQEVYRKEILVGETRERVILRSPADALFVQMPDKSYVEGEEAAYTWFVGLWKLFGGQGSAPSRQDLY